jgi:hypothetical protein
MEPRYYDAAGRIDYEAITAYSHRLRNEAIASLWCLLAERVASFSAKLLEAAVAHVNQRAARRPGHRSG